MNEDFPFLMPDDSPTLPSLPTTSPQNIQQSTIYNSLEALRIPLNFDLMSSLFSQHLQQSQNPQQQQQITQQQQLELRTVKGTWTQHEDDLLLSAINQYGTKKWVTIAKAVPSRTSKQCRARWFQKLSPDIKHNPFEQWEDQVIIDQQKIIGNHWSKIAKMLPGRSSSAVKNRWYSGLRNVHTAQAQLVDMSCLNICAGLDSMGGEQGFSGQNIVIDPLSQEIQNNDL